LQHNDNSLKESGEAKEKNEKKKKNMKSKPVDS
jgi:hypothetical protein